ncbi:MFS transporter [Sphaerisporangium melleum]|uniref:MFS transporter n=1 Tax=Sphaerisporangium melleum TaxID=321316 RepID=A0A917VGD1_9ACTN|nr:MFS transporter [Sphaerisporangium melleum]GGK74668.1 MFS transporter [Sphaerisporangium melleum]GII70944.1 MFS transporter [Sphaerisporangium melleum]
MSGAPAFTGPQRFMLVSSFVTTLGSFAVLPFTSVLLRERLGWELGTVGRVLAVASLLQFAGCVAGAAVAERLGLRRTLLIALVLHVAGFAGFTAGARWPVVTVAGLVTVCCGAALYLPAAKAYLVQDADERRRPRLLSASNAALNAGVALGPAAAGPFALGSSTAVFTTVTVLLALLTLGHVALPPPAPDDGRRPAEPVWRVLDRIAAAPFAVTAWTLYLHMCFYYYLPVYTVPRVSAAFYGLVLMLHSLILVVLQPLLAERVGRAGYVPAMCLGFAAMAAGMAVLALGGAAAIVAGAVVICLGEVVLFLKNDLEALARSPRSAAVVFGQQRVAMGIGAFGGGLVGGAGYGALDQAGHAPVFWLAVAAQCALVPLLVPFARRALAGRAGRAGVPAGDDIARMG